MAALAVPIDARAARLRDLHREMPDAARRTEHEHARSPGPTSAVSTSDCQAVSPASGSAAASTSLNASGVRASWRDGEVTYSA